MLKINEVIRFASSFLFPTWPTLTKKRSLQVTATSQLTILKRPIIQALNFRFRGRYLTVGAFFVQTSFSFFALLFGLNICFRMTNWQFNLATKDLEGNINDFRLSEKRLILLNVPLFSFDLET